MILRRIAGTLLKKKLTKRLLLTLSLPSLALVKTTFNLLFPKWAALQVTLLLVEFKLLCGEVGR